MESILALAEEVRHIRKRTDKAEIKNEKQLGILEAMMSQANSRDARLNEYERSLHNREEEINTRTIEEATYKNSQDMCIQKLEQNSVLLQKELHV